jgi:hypothetical protein
MLRCSHPYLFTLFTLATAAAALQPVHAAELGEARVSSHIGQPLVADIELALVDDPSAVVGVRLASPEVYQGAGLAMPPVLAGVNLSVMRRDGRQFLHVTSLRAVDSEHLHLYLELTDKGQRTVRLATLWLTPDPNPASASAPAFAPAFAPVAVARAEPASPPVPAAMPAPRPAAVRKTEPSPPPAEEGVKFAKFAKPAGTPHAKQASVEPKAAPAPGPQALPIHAPQPPAPATCAHQAEQAKVCAALDYKNAELKEQIGALEGKVKVLQVALGAAPAKLAAEPAAQSASTVPAGPKPINAIKPLVPRKPKAPATEPEAGPPWAWIAGGAALLLLVLSAAMLLRRRRRTVRKVDMPASPRLVERLRERFATRTKPAPAAVPEAAEPTLE